MTNPGRTSDVMLLITYSLRAGADARGYDDWLRRVDNPFFNAADCIAHYSNWKLTIGPDAFAPHTHFDLVALPDLESLDAAWNDPGLNDFRREWRRLWAIEDPTDPAADIQTCLCERVARSDMAWSDHLVLVPTARAEVVKGWDTWHVVRSLRGMPLGFDAFRIRFHAPGEAVDPRHANTNGETMATCIAAPADG